MIIFDGLTLYSGSTSASITVSGNEEVAVHSLNVTAGIKVLNGLYARGSIDFGTASIAANAIDWGGATPSFTDLTVTSFTVSSSATIANATITNATITHNLSFAEGAASVNLPSGSKVNGKEIATVATNYHYVKPGIFFYAYSNDDVAFLPIGLAPGTRIDADISGHFGASATYNIQLHFVMDANGAITASWEGDDAPWYEGVVENYIIHFSDINKSTWTLKIGDDPAQTYSSANKVGFQEKTGAEPVSILGFVDESETQYFVIPPLSFQNALAPRIQVTLQYMFNLIAYGFQHEVTKYQYVHANQATPQTWVPTDNFPDIDQNYGAPTEIWTSIVMNKKASS